MLNRQGRQTDTGEAAAAAPGTFTGNRALRIEEALIFEIGRPEVTGVDLEEGDGVVPRLGGLERAARIGLPGLSEPETLRHYVRLSRMNYGIDTGVFPLGSCTMKHNPRLNEKMARLPGFGDVHPLQPASTVPGALELMAELGRWLCVLTGMPAVALSPKAGAHGELCGMMAIKAALAARGEKRSLVLVPESAHGTNPATAALLGYRVETVPARSDGTVDPAEVEKHLSPDVAAVMLTNPNTCGLFERDVVAIADAVHRAGAYFYADGANFNAIVGKALPGELGVDAMHINLHKTFSTPHASGGPGAGACGVTEALVPFLPRPTVEFDGQRYLLDDDRPQSIGKIRPFVGVTPNLVRAYAWIMSLGATGLREVAEIAVLNNNYLMQRILAIKGTSAPYAEGHRRIEQVRYSWEGLAADTGISSEQIGVRAADFGVHYWTSHHPFVVSEPFTLEPTESYSRSDLDEYADILAHVAAEAYEDPARVASAPHASTIHTIDHSVLDDPARWAPSWRAYQRKVVGGSRMPAATA